MTDLLFDTPWWLPTMIIVVGGWLWISGNKRQDSALKRLGLAGIAAATVLAVVSYLVDTDLERAVKGTRAIVAAVENRDWPVMNALLAPNANFAIYNNRDQIVDGAKTATDQFGLRSVTVSNLVAEQQQTVITVTFTATTVLEATFDRPFQSNWQFTWMESADGWALQSIEVLDGTQSSQREILSNLPRLNR